MAEVIPHAFADEIEEKERQTWEAVKHSGKDLLGFLTEDCIMIFPGSTIFTHNSVPSLHEVLLREDLKPWNSYKFHNVHVLALGDGAASISYSVVAIRGEEQYEALITSIWRKKEDDWFMCLHQQSLKNI